MSDSMIANAPKIKDKVFTFVPPVYFFFEPFRSKPAPTTIALSISKTTVERYIFGYAIPQLPVADVNELYFNRKNTFSSLYFYFTL